MPSSPSARRVDTGEVSIAVRVHSPAGRGRPTVVMVHGYPDSQQTWNALVEELPLDAWHVVTYDVRGAGGTDAPTGRSSYRTERLVDDLVAVLDGVLADGERVHLVGHDWGSVQLWDAVAAEGNDARLRGRIASFTSVSGPSLDHVARLSRSGPGRRRAILRQQLHSLYVALFCLPLVPVLLWRLGHRPLGAALAAREGLPRGHWGPGLGADAVHGLELYRANVFQRLRRPGRLHTDVPVLVIHPTGDRFLTSVVTEDLDRVCSDLRVETVDAGHWVIVTHAAQIAELVREHVGSH